MKANHSLTNRLQAFWLARSAQEKALLRAAGLLLLLLALFLLFGWQHNERQRLRRALPQAEARLGQMQVAAEEYARLQAQPPAARLSDKALQEALRAAAAARGLELLLETTGEGVLVKGAGGFDALVAWLADAQRDHALRPLRLEILREGNGARLETTLVFPPNQ